MRSFLLKLVLSNTNCCRDNAVYLFLSESDKKGF